jgi:hypothetical protein
LEAKISGLETSLEKSKSAEKCMESSLLEKSETIAGLERAAEQREALLSRESRRVEELSALVSVDKTLFSLTLTLEG